MADEKIDFDFSSAVDQSAGLDMEIFGGAKYIKNPEVGQTILLNIVDIKDDSKNAMGKTKEGQEFCKGFTDRNGIHKYNVVTEDGSIYTPKSAEVFYSMGRALQEYKKKNPNIKPSWMGAKISIRHIYDGMHADMKLPLLKASLSIEPYNKKDITDDEAAKYQAEVKQAKKEYRLYEVKLVN